MIVAEGGMSRTNRDVCGSGPGADNAGALNDVDEEELPNPLLLGEKEGPGSRGGEEEEEPNTPGRLNPPLLNPLLLNPANPPEGAATTLLLLVLLSKLGASNDDLKLNPS